MVKFLPLFFLLLFMIGCSHIQKRSLSSLVESKKRRVLIIGLDGTTGNQFHEMVWEKNRAPNFKELMIQGKYSICEKDRDSRCARTHSGPRYQKDYLWKTAPGWTSVLTGVDNGHHGVKNNEDESLRVFSETSKLYPTFLKRARDLGVKTAAGGVGAFISSHLDNDIYYGALDYECGHEKQGPAVQVDATESCNASIRLALNSTDPERDEKLSIWMKNQIEDESVGVIMGVFDRIDEAGHSSGFDSNKNYLSSIAVVDTQIAKMIDAIKTGVEIRNEEWLVMVTADHGGHRNPWIFGGSHGNRLHEDEVIPFIVTTFGTAEALKELASPVTHMDVHPTVMKWLNNSAPKSDGKVQALP